MSSLPQAGHAQQTVFWRGNADNGRWADDGGGDGDNHWFRSNDEYTTQRPDLAFNIYPATGTKSYNIIIFDNAHQATTTVNGNIGGAKYHVAELRLANGTDRTFNTSDGGYLAMSNASGVAKIESIAGGTGTYTFNVPILFEEDTEINADNGNLVFNSGSSITNNGFKLLSYTVSGKQAEYKGIISGSGGLEHKGAGLVILDAVNTYTGATTVEAAGGRIQIKNASALGGTATNTTVSSGAALEVFGSLGTINENITLTGTGVSDGGALRNLSGSSTWAGSVTLGGNTRINSDSGTLTISGGIDVTAANTLFLGGAGNITIDNNLTNASKTSGDGAIFWNGGGTLRFNQATQSGLTGNIALRSGTVLLGADTALGTGAVTVGQNSALTLASADTTARSIGNNITMSGADRLNLGQSSGGTGNLALGGALAFGATGDNHFLNVAASTTKVTINGIISGASKNLVKEGGGTLSLSANNTYSGGTFIDSGIVEFTAGTSAASGIDIGTTAGLTASNATLRLVGANGYSLGQNINIRSGGNRTIEFANAASTTNTLSGSISHTNKAFTINVANSGATALLSGVIGNTGDGPTISITGSGTVGVSNTGNTTDARWNIGSGATLAIGASRNLGADPVGYYGDKVTLAGGTLRATNNFSLSSNFGIQVTSASTISVDNGLIVTNPAVMGGTAGITKSGAGTLLLSGANTNSGKWTISQGVLSVGSADNFGVNPGSGTGDAITIAGGTLTTSAGMTLGNRGITMGTGGGTINVSTGGLTNTAGLNGSTALLKTGTGTLVLATTAGNYNGTATISGGTLVANTTLSSADVTISNTGTLMGTGTLDTVIVQSGGTISPGNSPGTLSVGALTLEGGGSYLWEITTAPGVAGTDWDLISVNSGGGVITLNATSGNRFTIDVVGSSPTGFSAGTSYTWDIIDAGSWSAAFDDTAFTINTNNFSAAGTLGSWTVQDSSGNLRLVYTALATDYDVTVSSGSSNQAVADGGAALFTGGVGVNKLGAGTLVMTNPLNDYTGLTTVKAGTVSITANAPTNSAGSLGNSTNAVVVGDTAAAAAAGFNFGAAVTNDHGLNIIAGTGAADRTIGTTIGSGIAVQAGAVTLSTNATFTAASGGTLSVSGLISGAGSATISGEGGTVDFTGNNTGYSGTTTLSSGTLRVGNNNALGTGGLTLNGGRLASASGTGYTLTNAITVGGNVGFGQASGGTGALTLSGALGLGASTRSFDVSNSTTLSGIISGSAGIGLTKTGSGTLTISAANTYTGTTTLNGGVLSVSGGSAIGDTNVVTITSGTLNIGANETVGSIGGAGNIALNGNQLIAGQNGSSTTFSGVMSSSSTNGNFVKRGAGTLTLSGANTMNGPMYLVGGTTLFTVNQGGTFTNTLFLGEEFVDTVPATLAFGGSGLTIANAITVRDGSSGTMVIDAVNSTGTTTLSGAITLGKNTTIRATNDGSLLVNGNVSLGSSQLFADNTAGTSLIFAGNISAANRSAELLVNNSGTVVLSGNNSADMKITLSAGTLQAGALTNLGSPGTAFSDKLNFNGGTLSATGNITTTANFGMTVSVNGGGINVASGQTLELGGLFGAASGATITKTGAGTLFLNNAGTSTLTGTTMIVREGTLSTYNPNGLLSPTVQLGGATGGSAVGTYRFTKTDGGVFTTRNFEMNLGGGTIEVTDDFLGVTGTITGSGSLTKTGNGILIISNSGNTFSGGFNLAAGTVEVGISGAALGATNGTITMANGTTLTTQSGTGRSITNNLVLNGDVTIGTSGKGRLTIGGGTTRTTALGSATRAITVTGLATINNQITGGAADVGLTKLGAGTLTIGAAATYTGATTVGGGTLAVTGAGNRINTNSSLIVSNGAAFAMLNGAQAFAAISGAGNISLDTNILTHRGVTDSTFSGGLSGTGALVKAGSATFTLSGDNSSFTGKTTISGGVLSINADNRLGAAPGSAVADQLTLSGGTLDVSTGFTMSANRGITLSSNSGISVAASQNLSYGGIITGASQLTKTGTGTLTLTGGNTLTGALNVNGGMVILNRSGGSALAATNAVNINNGGTLRTDAAGQLVGSPLVTLATGGTYNLNSFAQTNALAGEGGTVQLGSATLAISNTGNNSFSGVIEGAGGLNKIGAGTQTLAGANTYGGLTTISNGLLRLGGSGTTIAGNVTIAGGALDYSSATDNQIATNATINISGGSFDLGARQQTLAVLNMTGGSIERAGAANNLTLTGASTLAGGTVNMSVAGSDIRFDSTLALGGATLSFSNASAATAGVRFSNTVTYAATNTVAANFTNSAAGVGRVNLGGGTIEFNVGDAGSLASEINMGWSLANGGLLKTGDGVMTITSSGTFAGGTTINGGGLRAGDNSAFGSGSLTLSNGFVSSDSATGRTFANALTIGGNVTFGQAAGGTGVLNFSSSATNDLGGATRTLTTLVDTKIDGAIGNGGISKAGAGTLSLSNANSSFGDLAISAGRVAFQTNATITGLTGSGGDLAIAGGTLTVNASTNSSFGQIISGSGALTKSGAGTVTLSANNTYSGATTIGGGTLAINGTNTSSVVTVGSGGTLAGTGSVGATTVQSGGLIAPGNSIGTLVVDALTLEGGGGYVWEVGDVTGAAGTAYDQIRVGDGTGAATITATAGNPFTIYLTSYTGFTNWNSAGTFAWNIIDWGTVTGFDASAFTVNTNDFTGTIAGTFTFADSGGFLVMSYASGTPTYDTNSGTWSAGFVPALANGNSVIFDGPGGNATNDIASATVASIANLTFSNTAGSYTLSASSGAAGFNSASPLAVNGNIVNNSSNAQTINLALGFDADRTIDAAAGNMIFGGTISNGVGLLFTGASNNTVSGVVSGAGTITKGGNGTLVLSGANDYTGATTVSNGVLQIGNATALGTAAAGTTVISGATLDLNGQAVGAEALSLAGTGVGGNGALINSSASASSLSGALTLTGNTTVGTTGNMTLSGAVGGAFSLTKIGAATLTLSGNNNYSGGTVISAGSVLAGNNNAFGTGAITINGGGLGSTGSSRTFANNLVAGGDFFLGGGGQVSIFNGNLDLGGVTRAITFSNKATLNGIISNGGLTINASGIATDIVMDGINTYTGPTTINGGELVLTNDGSLSATTAVDLTGSAGTAALDIEFISSGSTTIGSLAASNNASATTVVLGSKTLIAGGNNNNTTFNGAMSGTGGFTKTGTGTMTIGAASSYTGATTISNGEIALSGSGRLANTTAINLAGATARYDISAKSASAETNGSLAGIAGSIVNLGTNKNLNVGGDNTSTTFAGILTNSGSLTKSGTGTMTLSGANTFSGGSTLSAGVLRLSSTGALGTGSLTQTDSTSTLQVNAGGTITNNLSVYNVEFVNGGNTLSGTITQNNTTYDVNVGETNTLSGFLTGSGGVELIGGGQLNITGATNNYTDNTVISNGTLQISTLANSNTVSSIGVDNNVTLAGANATNAVLDYTGGNVTTDRTFVMNEGGGTINMASSSTEMTLTGSASGDGKLIVGEGTLVLSNTSTANSFAPDSIQVDSGATLKLAASDQIGNSTGLILNGGTFLVDATNVSETMGSLTLTGSANSVIDFGDFGSSGTRSLTFASFNAVTWTGSLIITNWQGSAWTPENTHLYFTDSSGFTESQLANQIVFADIVTGGGIIDGGELVPVPEPRVYAAAVALLAVVGWRERKRLRELLGKVASRRSKK